MSLDQAKAFIEKMKSDVAFRERVLAIDDVAERFQLINSEGYECSEAEINEVIGVVER
jgi:predicted ribosomally synthesized peptide with nif11-like leader